MNADVDRADLVGRAVTLDGFPATIAGRRLDYAIVARLDGHGRFEWSWPAAARIVANGGRFES